MKFLRSLGLLKTAFVSSNVGLKQDTSLLPHSFLRHALICILSTTPTAREHQCSTETHKPESFVAPGFPKSFEDSLLKRDCTTPKVPQLYITNCDTATVASQPLIIFLQFDNRYFERVSISRLILAGGSSKGPCGLVSCELKSDGLCNLIY